MPATNFKVANGDHLSSSVSFAISRLFRLMRVTAYAINPPVTINGITELRFIFRRTIVIRHDGRSPQNSELK
jgi:hypothetical protein